LDWTDAPPDAGGLGATIVRLWKPLKMAINRTSSSE
jgi:hypothetical protein